MNMQWWPGWTWNHTSQVTWQIESQVTQPISIGYQCATPFLTFLLHSPLCSSYDNELLMRQPHKLPCWYCWQCRPLLISHSSDGLRYSLGPGILHLSPHFSPRLNGNDVPITHTSSRTSMVRNDRLPSRDGEMRVGSTSVMLDTRECWAQSESQVNLRALKLPFPSAVWFCVSKIDCGATEQEC